MGWWERWVGTTGALLLLASTGCGDCGGPSVHDDGGPKGYRGDGAVSGQAALRFQVTWGAGAAAQIDPRWRDRVPGWESDAPLVFFLCEADDARCEAPLDVQQVSADEREGEPLTEAGGPVVRIASLPEGRFRVAVMADSPASRDRGFGWDDDFETRERAWGGLASEGDLLTSEAAADDGANPAAASFPVTLGEDEVDLGMLTLGHYHERPVSPAPAPEPGVVAVAVDGGLRLVDLERMGVATTAGEGETIILRDADGAPVEGEVCGLVRGPGSTVFVLHRDPVGGGFAVPYDVALRAQLHDGTRVRMPGTSDDTPCRGLYHQHDSEAYLFATNAPSAPDEPAKDGFWYAKVTPLFERDVTAERLDGETADRLYELGIDAIAANGGRLFLAVSATADDTVAPMALRGRHAVIRATFQRDGRPVLRDTLTDALVPPLLGPTFGAGYGGDPEGAACEGELGHAGLATVRFHDGRELLLLGGCAEVAVYDLEADPPAPLDYNGELAGTPGIDGRPFGQGFTSFSVSTDGTTVWAVPQRPASAPLVLSVGEDDRGEVREVVRHMALPIRLDAGDRPALDPAFDGGDLDGDGEADPGLDLRHVAYLRYLFEWAPGIEEDTFAPSLLLDGVSMVAGERTAWLLGSDPGSAAGLGKGDDLSVFDLDTGRAVLWPRDGGEAYGLWTGGPDMQPPFGFDLTPEGDVGLGTHGAVAFAEE